MSFYSLVPGTRVKVVKLAELDAEGPDPAERWLGRTARVFGILTEGKNPLPVGVEFYDGTELWFGYDELEVIE